VGDETSIEWTDATWNPIRGCSRVSPGCENCYAERTAARFGGKGLAYEGLATIGKNGPRWTGKVKLVREHLADPLRWRRGRRIFVNSMSDLFHESLSFETVAAIFGVMAAAPHHTFQVLTKRPERMAAWFAWHAEEVRRRDLRYERWRVCEDAALEHIEDLPAIGCLQPWPLPNVWLGTTVEDQARADERIPHLLRTPAAVRFLSCEPLLEAISFRPRCDTLHEKLDALESGDASRPAMLDGIDWVIVGAESGPGARLFDLAWARSIVEQCKTAGVPVFVKQLGARPVANVKPTGNFRTNPRTNKRELEVLAEVLQLDCRKGNDPAEWPEDLRLREMPEGRS
jgi:protein gp37